MRTGQLCHFIALMLVGSASLHCAAWAEPCGSDSTANARAAQPGAVLARAAAPNNILAPTLFVDRLYRLTLLPRDKMTFPVTPDEKTLLSGGYAGLARLRIARAGVYRISVSQPIGVAVEVHGDFINPMSSSVPPCAEFPESLEYSLPRGANLFLEISGARVSNVQLTITRASTPGG